MLFQWLFAFMAAEADYVGEIDAAVKAFHAAMIDASKLSGALRHLAMMEAVFQRDARMKASEADLQASRAALSTEYRKLIELSRLASPLSMEEAVI